VRVGVGVMSGVEMTGPTEAADVGVGSRRGRDRGAIERNAINPPIRRARIAIRNKMDLMETALCRTDKPSRLWFRVSL